MNLESNILRNIIFPKENICPKSDLYYRSDSGGMSEKALNICGKTVFDTYFNSFPIGKYMEYCIFSGLFLKLRVCGIFILKIFGVSENMETLILEREIHAESILEDVTDISACMESGFSQIYFSLESESGILYGGEFSCTAEKLNNINIAVVICTFKREKFLLRNHREICEYLESQNVLNESNTVSSNVFYNNSMALKCLKSNKIMNNSFSYNENCAQLAGSSNELVSNSFSHNTIGIKLIQSNSNIIKSNSFSCNYQNSIKGTGSRNQLKGNKFTNNGLSGKYCNVYIRGDENKASKNIFKNNNYHALHFNGNKTIITNNIFKDTGNISLRVNGNNIKIKNNNFTGNKNTQMQVFGNNNRIYNNIIKNGSGRGISIYGNHNKIFKNKVKSNKLIGVYIKGKLNNLTRNNATGSKKGILIHGDKNIIFKSNIKKNNNIGTHILGNSNQLSKNNITKSNKGLFIHGNKNNILQNVIKNNEIGVHNYKSKNNKINYNYIVNKKHNLYGNGSIDADYNWWGKNKPSKVSKSFKINKFVVMYLTAPHTLKINKTYKISIRFKDNEDKKLKYSIPSLSTKHYFNDYIKTNESMVKHNALKTVIRVNKERDCYELKIVCDGETIIKSYYYDNGKITIEKPDSVVHIYKFENKDGKNKNKLKAGSNSSIPYYLSDLFGKFYKNSYFKKFLNFCLKYSQGFKLNSSRSYNENGVLFVSYFAKRLSGDIITGKQSVHGFEFLKTSAFAFYTFGAFCEAFINCNGDPIAFLKYPFSNVNNPFTFSKKKALGWCLRRISSISKNSVPRVSSLKPSRLPANENA